MNRAAWRENKQALDGTSRSARIGNLSLFDGRRAIVASRDGDDAEEMMMAKMMMMMIAERTAKVCSDCVCACSDVNGQGNEKEKEEKEETEEKEKTGC
ncbi:hypothetical protein L596_008601 [Steinernema carpocapsae]|uniref:Uncharacterized protein n=1 Tax=Steinernema carpocapsae TaxID=34508 RepID=A0A4U5PD34_STECR|nr:hypothetical protein L596_008601 [Steinernema carpocapsae]